MRMKMYLLAGFVTSVWVASVAAAEKPAQPEAKSAELKVLERFVGAWDTETTIAVAEGKPKGTRLKGLTTVEWALGGRFLQWKGSSNPGQLEDLQVITVDPAKKVYRHWYFSSEGVAEESVGQWDEGAKTMTWQADLGAGKALTNKVRFIDKDNQEWNLVVKDKAGKVVVDLQGKFTRRK